MKMDSRLTDLISKNTNLHVQRFFCLSLPLFCRTTMPFCATKSSNLVVSHYFYGGIVVRACQRFFFPCSCSLLFFSLPLISTLLAASISHFLTAPPL